MRTTYINDQMNVAYPLYAGDSIPFSPSIFMDMSICLRTSNGYSEAVRLAYLKIDGSMVYGTLYHGNSPVGEFAYDYSQSSAVASISPLGDATICGYVVFGTIQSSYIGEWTGSWRLDPACVTVMGDSEYSRYGDKLWINGSAEDAPKVLSVRTDGAAHIMQDAEIGLDMSMMGTDFIVGGESTSDVGVKGINGIDAMSDSGTYLYIRNNSRDKICIYGDDDPECSTCFVVTISGLNTFPSCYDRQSDEASKRISI